LRTGGENLSPIENIIREVKEEIAKLSQVLRLLEGTPTTGKRSAQKSTARPTRKISAAGRKRIAAAQRARWAKIRAAKKG
jgi:16S rRNA C1402 N4-methylase RsmH